MFIPQEYRISPVPLRREAQRHGLSERQIRSDVLLRDHDLLRARLVGLPRDDELQGYALRDLHSGGLEAVLRHRELDGARLGCRRRDERPEHRDCDQPLRVHVVLLSSYCDPLRIEQVLANLVSNAIKYSPAGGEVRATLRTANGEAVIQVADQGIGIPERDRGTIFEPFRRTGSLRSAVAGTGLGLYVVRRLVEAHAGSVAVASIEGVGTIFTVRLPLAHDAPELVPESAPAAPATP
jgi:signal transduction histidine kinase